MILIGSVPCEFSCWFSRMCNRFVTNTVVLLKGGKYRTVLLEIPQLRNPVYFWSDGLISDLSGERIFVNPGSFLGTVSKEGSRREGRRDPVFHPERFPPRLKFGGYGRGKP